MTPQLIGGLLLVLSLASQAAPDVTLEVVHRSSQLGTDGVLRSAEFSERVMRRGDTVWVERVLPAGAEEASAHQHVKADAHASHKHMDLGAATRWIQRGSDGKVKLRLVSEHDRTVVDIAAAEYGTVGFDGSWLAAYHLIDPAVLKQLKPGEASGPARWFETVVKPGVNKVRVLWDAKLELPLQVQSVSSNGLVKRQTQVRVLRAGQAKPWAATSSYSVKDYADFLD
jgi:hypothetical protein